MLDQGVPDVDADTRATVERRLAYIEGHIGGVRRMVEADQHCADVLRQTHAVRRAIKQLDSKLVSGHLQHCLIEGAERRGDDLADDLVEVCDLAFR